MPAAAAAAVLLHIRSVASDDRTEAGIDSRHALPAAQGGFGKLRSCNSSCWQQELFYIADIERYTLLIDHSVQSTIDPGPFAAAAAAAAADAPTAVQTCGAPRAPCKASLNTAARASCLH